MADLEEAGFLAHPHTSAGRVPTASGYRAYVRSLKQCPGLRPEDVRRIRESLAEGSDTEALMSRASQVLSSFSDSIGFVLAPPLSRSVMKHIEFLAVGEQRILVIIVSRAGLVQHRMIRIAEKLSQSDLDQAGRYLVTNFTGLSLVEIRLTLLRMMSQERALYDRILRNAVLLGSATLSEDQEAAGEEPEVFVGGASKVVNKLESSELNRLTDLLEALEEKKLLVRLISECLEEGRDGPSVTIGLDHHIPGLGNWALITSPFHCDRDAQGSLGILGPSRMEYDRAISIVDFVARLFGQLMDQN